MQKIEFMTSLLTFYLKGEISTEQNFLTLKVPNTILTLIPLGRKNDTIPVTQISSVSTDFKLLFKDFLIGIIVAIIGIVLFGTNFLIGFILLLIGVAMVINSFQIVLTIRTTSGEIKSASILIFEKSKAEQAASMINHIIGSRLDDTNNRVQGDRQTDRMVEAINSLKGN